MIWLQQCIAALDIPLLYICGFNPIPGASNKKKNINANLRISTIRITAEENSPEETDQPTIA